MSIKQNEVKVIIAGPVGSGKSAIAGLLADALRFIHMPFQWGDERDEVNLTGGNWVKQLIESDAKVTIVEQLTEDPEKRTGLGFGAALAALEEGKSVYREGWNGKGMFISMVREDYHIPAAEAARAYYGTARNVKHNPFFQIRNVDDSLSTWVPSVNDCLAKDWCITLDTNVE